MILLGGVVAAVALALALGGRLARLAELELRSTWTVAGALAVQIALFTRLGGALPDAVARSLHLATYGLLVLFAMRNARVRALWALAGGMVMNFVVIAANGGRMPLDAAAARVAGLTPASYANVSTHAHRLWFLGDVFALPKRLPGATVVSPGDVLIVVGTIAFVVLVSLGDRGRPPLDVRRLVAPLNVATYRRLATARFVSYLGDWLTIAAVVGWIYHRTGSTAAVVGVMLARIAPPIVGGGVAAFVVDRLPRRGLLVSLELGRAVCIGGALAAISGGSRVGVIAALACSGALTAVSNAATAALVPALLDPERLAAGNALLALLRDVAMALGAVAAGIALDAGRTVPALAVDIGTFLVSALLLRGLLATPRRSRRGGALEGLRVLRGRRLVLLLIASFSTATAATGLVNATLPSLLSSHGLGAGGYGFGMAALAGGAAVGEAIVGLCALAPTADRWIGGGLLTMAVLFGLLAVTSYGPTALLCIAAVGCVDGTTDVVYSTVLQRESDERHLGAVFGLSTSMMTTTMVLSFALAPVGGALVGSAGVVAIAAGVLAMGAVLALVAVRPARTPVPAPLPVA